jgi:hypothetical protein
MTTVSTFTKLAVQTSCWLRFDEISTRPAAAPGHLLMGNTIDWLANVAVERCNKPEIVDC